MGVNNEADTAGRVSGGRCAFNQQRLHLIGQTATAAECDPGSDGVKDGLGGCTGVGFRAGECCQQQTIFFTGTQAIGRVITAAVGCNDRRVQNVIHTKQAADSGGRVGHLRRTQGGWTVSRAADGFLSLVIGESGQHVNIENEGTVVSGDNTHAPELRRKVFARASRFVQVVSSAAAVDELNNHHAAVTARRDGYRAIGSQRPCTNQRFAIGLINLYIQIVTAERRAADKIKLDGVLYSGFSTAVIVLTAIVTPAMTTRRGNPDHATQCESASQVAHVRVRLRKVGDRMARHHRAILQAG